LKFWKKTPTGVEFVKHYRSHISSIAGISLSADHELLATVSDDMALKVYDVTNFGKGRLEAMKKAQLTCSVLDMINMIKLSYKPKSVCWIHQKGQAQALVAV
jgi:peptidylprolyl isomerase domain and WD repeat-containing protein 1